MESQNQYNQGITSDKNTSTIMYFLFVLSLIWHIIDVLFFYTAGGTNILYRFFFHIVFAFFIVLLFRNHMDKSSISMVLGVLIFILGFSSLMGYLQSYIPMNLLPFVGFVYVFIAPWSVYLLMLQNHAQIPVGLQWVTFIWLFLLLLSVLTFIFQAGMLQVDNMPINPDNTVFIVAYWNWVKQTVQEAPDAIRQVGNVTQQRVTTFQRQLRDPHFEADVERSRNLALGVRILPVQIPNQQYREGQRIILTSEIEAQNFDINLPLNLSCFAHHVQTKENIEGSVSQETVQVSRFYKAPFTCVFDSLPAGTYDIFYAAHFPFVTSALIRRYLIDYTVLTDFVMNNQDPFAQFQIRDRNPISIHTSGPVKLGINTPPVLIPLQEANNAFELRVLFEAEQGWSGKITQLEDVYVFLPKGVELDRCEGVGFDVVSPNTFDCSQDNAFCFTDSDAFNAYRFNKDELLNSYDLHWLQTSVQDTVEVINTAADFWLGVREVITQPKDVFFVVPCQIYIDDNYLQGTPYAPISLRTTALYDYVVTQKTRITVTPDEQQQVDGGQEKQTIGQFSSTRYATDVQVEDYQNALQEFNTYIGSPSFEYMSLVAAMYAYYRKEIKLREIGTIGCQQGRCGPTLIDYQGDSDEDVDKWVVAESLRRIRNSDCETLECVVLPFCANNLEYDTAYSSCNRYPSTLRATCQYCVQDFVPTIIGLALQVNNKVSVASVESGSGTGQVDAGSDVDSDTDNNGDNAISDNGVGRTNQANDGTEANQVNGGAQT
ncbi:MAG: hypothetical protein ACMXYC_00420 [Candidatus Woesearchaeota archaeon]